MSTPTPTPLTIYEVTGEDDEQGPLVRQRPAAAQLARVYHHAAVQLWDLATQNNETAMIEQAKLIAKLILAAGKRPRQ